jgi:hypothetical protein
MLCVLAVIALAWATSAQAALMLINYDIGGTTPTGAGVIGTTGDVWNSRNAAGTGWKGVDQWNLANLVDSTGASSGASLAITQPTGFKGNNGDQGTGVNSSSKWPTNNRYPFDRSLGDGSSGRIVFTISGLDDDYTYDVYVLWSYDAPGTSRASVDTSPTDPSDTWGKTLTWSTRSTDPVEGQDYVVFSGVSATGGVIQLLTKPADSNRGLSGFQILQVPEPATMALLALGGLGLLLGRKRK